MIKRAAAVVLTAAALLLLSGAFGFRFSGYQPEPANTTDPLTLSIDRAQQRLKDVPGDWQTWAGLGSSYVEVARVTGDPTLYERAEAALTKSQTLRPNDAALAGLGALANARHDFAAAEKLARQATGRQPPQRHRLRRARRRPDPAGPRRRSHRSRAADARPRPGPARPVAGRLRPGTARPCRRGPAAVAPRARRRPRQQRDVRSPAARRPRLARRQT